MARRKSFFQRAKKAVVAKAAKFKKARVNRAAKIEKSKARAVAKRERRAQRAVAKRRAGLINNRAVGGISNAAREHLGDGTVSLAEAIIISRLEKKGALKDHNHDQIKDMALRMIGARARSIGFLAAGWLQSIKVLAGKVGKPFRAGKGLKTFQANQVGKLGTCIPARSSFKPRCYIWNHANAKRDHADALTRYGRPALQRSVDQETKDTILHLENKLRASARRQGIKTK